MKKSLPLHSQIRNEAYNTNKHGADNGLNDKQTIFDKNYIKLFCREVQETNEHSNKECLGLKSHLSIPSEINLTGVLSTNRE